MFQTILDDRAASENEPAEPLVWNVSLNRKALPVLEKSVAAVKADAARNLFNVKCNKLVWAIVDSGIDPTHPAFQDDKGNPRVKAVYDFRNIRQIISLDNTNEETLKDRVDERAKVRSFSDENAHKSIQGICERPVDSGWQRISKTSILCPGTW